MKMLLPVVALGLFVMSLCPFSPPCPLHDVAITHLVRTEFSDGHQVGVYSCSRGHEFYMRCQ